MTTQKIDYAPVDAAILALIKSNPKASPSANRDLQGRVLSLAYNEPVERFDVLTVAWDGMRMIDRRLQAMKKAGKIQFSKEGRAWVAK